MYTKFLSHWLKAKNEGASFTELFERNNWKTISIYGAGTLGELLYDEIHKEINIANVIDIKAKELGGVVFRGRVSVIEPKQVADTKKIDAVIITPYFSFFEIRKTLKKYTKAQIIAITEILGAEKPEGVFVDISKYLESIGVSLYFMSRPTIKIIENPSLLEHALMHCPLNAFVDAYSLNHDLLKYFYDGIDQFSEDYFKAVVRPGVACTSDSHGRMIIKSRKNSYVNFINGNRVLPDFQESYNNLIHIFGDCSVFGQYVDDSTIMANQLQKKLNSSGKKYGVIAHSIQPAPSQEFITVDFLKELPLKRGDVVMSIFLDYNKRNCFFRFFRDLKNIYKVDLTPYFGRPHSYGEIYVDGFHLLPNGHLLLADAIFDILHKTEECANKGIEQLECTNEFRFNTAANHYMDTKYELDDFLEFLKSEKVVIDGRVGAVVVNCNPFTRGHQLLIETAASEVDFLYVFVVEEDKSEYPFDDRIKLVRRGVEHLKNVKILPSGKFIISTITFEGYFNKEQMPEVEIDASEDVEIFAGKIAPVLDISVRFAGSEPFCNITRQYNRDMSAILPRYGIEFREIDRFTHEGIPISASAIRKLIAKGKIDECKDLLPQITFDYLRKRMR